MVKRIIEIVLQLTSIGLVIAAAGLWAGAGVDARPRHRDEQTLVGGAIWSQIIIPIGLMISKIVEEQIDVYVQGYYVITGIFLLWLTGAFLIAHEMKWFGARNRANTMPHMTGHLSHSSRHLTHNARVMSSHILISQFDRAYYAIGVICTIAGAVKLGELIFVIVKST
ncbi:uncharacterized protein LOC111348173 [Spodoptera litura]|uniref:Uncharacterized protein LOC111348173 n=1 Tax=Spodoptera litura TaxID=69820 RepID=A0A9J7DNZ7_SPOLT|nr:uncharacterized protein LOC111348173 [Spodoptera litura]